MSPGQFFKLDQFVIFFKLDKLVILFELDKLVILSELDKLVIFDTTLRDGEQSPGATLNTAEKLAIAKQISRLGVDVCEAGFPIASPGDFEAVKLIATEVGPMMENRTSGKPMQICGLARAMEGDIERCYDAVSPAPLHRIHTFLATRRSTIPPRRPGPGSSTSGQSA